MRVAIAAVPVPPRRGGPPVRTVAAGPGLRAACLAPVLRAAGPGVRAARLAEAKGQPTEGQEA